jgi:hemerythrin-like domain-containing protein
MSHSAAKIIRDEHAALAAMLRSLGMMIDHGPGDEPERFFDVLRAMLFYIDEFPERRHHPKESKFLFPRLAVAAPETRMIIQRLEAEHASGERRVRRLQHLLLAWELIGEPRRHAFIDAAHRYVRFYLDHMRTEETQLLTVAERVLSPTDWTELDKAFSSDSDPLAGGARDPCYNRLFARIVLAAPAPIGVGTSVGTPAERSALV